MNRLSLFLTVSCIGLLAIGAPVFRSVEDDMVHASHTGDALGSKRADWYIRGIRKRSKLWKRPKIIVTPINDWSDNVLSSRYIGIAGRHKGKHPLQKLEKRPKIVVTPISDRSNSEFLKRSVDSNVRLHKRPKIIVTPINDRTEFTLQKRPVIIVTPDANKRDASLVREE